VKKKARMLELNTDDVRMMRDPRGIERWGPAQERAERVKAWALEIKGDQRLTWWEVITINAAAECLGAPGRLSDTFNANGMAIKKRCYTRAMIRRLFQQREE
jgi:hypothetical protein